MFGLSYWFLPLFAGCTWLGTLLAMLGRWVAIGSPHYPEMEPNQQVAFISDVGATSWGKPLFIAGSAVAVVVFDLAFVSERWLRHKGRLTKNYNRTEKILSVFATIFAIVGAAGLILLTIFDTRRHPKTHRAMLVVFIAGYIISAIFICAEYQRLGIHYRDYRILAISFWIKLGFIFLEIALVIAFGVLQLYDMYNPAAYIEWIISLVYIFYVWSYIIDFLPATKTRSYEDRFVHPHEVPKIRAQDDEMAMQTQANGNMMGGPVYSGGGGQPDAADTYLNYRPNGQEPSRNF
ncbi:related to FK506 suppressor Sfk1 [Ramularia collo-cygni]|uniref:Related to FK506 suppressor Sfk1 n=1 Tax=Ramularia collo-cygni TaxID=112498 RepID=A0A2D3V6N4_9PEZI|nr:related to FK506 suppressor Sfk1 [Ramularia collo-cygni]CZT18194.1 related to FK506 suppressor Sfk1 [Ramularia collo-cygni]